MPDYRTTTARTPVTYYRPILTTDPNTGAQVIVQAPCTSYEYQTQRVPTWGLTQVYNGGATLPPTGTVPAPVSPTYTLPKGGVPLSGPVGGIQPYASSYAYSAMMPPISSVTPVTPSMGTITPAAPTLPAAPTTSSPYSSGYSGYASNYGNYSALQPPVGAPPATTYRLRRTTVIRNRHGQHRSQQHWWWMHWPLRRTRRLLERTANLWQ